MKKRSLGLNAFLNGLRNVLNLIFPLITFPYVSHVLSVDGMGKYNFSGNYVGYYTLIAGLGIATYAVREGAKYRDNYQKISDFASQVFTINVVSTLVAYVLLFISLIVFKNLRAYLVCILIFSLTIVFTTIGTEWVYTIFEDYSYITIRSIAFKIISIVLLFIFVKKPGDYLWYAAITVFSSVGSNVLNFIHAKTLCSVKIVKNVNWKYHLKPILIIFSSSIAVSIYAISDVTILWLLKGDYAVGIYSVATKIQTVSQGLLTAILTVTIPRLAMLFGQRRFREYHRILGNLINTLAMLVLPMAVGIIMLSKEITLIIAGKKYLDSVMALRIIAWTIVFSLFSWLLSDCVLLPAKREKYILRNTITCAIFNVVLNFILIPFISYDGSSLSTVLTELLSMMLNYYRAKDIVKDVVLSKQNQYNIITGVLGCCLIAVICMVIKLWSLNILLTIVLSVVCSGIGYFALLYLLRNTVVVTYWLEFKERAGIR